ncbi:uncharacterized protein LOC124127995 isoform X2 [Haliotis rufescens]|uniref:uncharacterized protein LOC124127995 isoform X2 n=1 Tax=Haliotis rufescens TaxID=6454 RepID=UPI00201EB0F0|nr:uncharacterized protein LOC124127995 isoform X2 [Haliotis rufescens]
MMNGLVIYYKMAAARKLESLNENFLTCSICTDGYKDPCTLTCGHTFCKVCLWKFLKTRQDAIRAKSILCPYCRQMTQVPRPDRPVEEWVKQIKPSFLIQGLLDTLACGGNTDHDTENRCHPCQDLGESHPANSYCQDCDVPLCERCVKMHASLPGTSNHVIADLGGSVKVTRRQRCTEHNEVTEFCCKDCNIAICNKCSVTYHRKCDSVVTIQSMMSEMRNALAHNKGLITQSFDDTGRSLQQHKSQIDEISHNKDTIKSHKTVGIKVDGDRKQPYPYDVTVLVVDGEETLVVSDCNNKCLKSFYTKNNKSRHSKLDLASNKSSVTRLRDNQVAVSVWSHNEIVIVRVTPDLVLQSRVTTKKKYRCLTALSPSTLAAGCRCPPCVDILDISGIVMRSVSRFNTGKNLICNPCYLCATDRGNILVSDACSHSVYCITPEGDVVFTYTPTGERRLRGPRGITNTSTGHILVADTRAHRVVLLTPTGEFVRDLLTSQDGLQNPCGLMFCDCKLYVAEYRADAVKEFNCSIPQ